MSDVSLYEFMADEVVDSVEPPEEEPIGDVDPDESMESGIFRTSFDKVF